MKNFKHYSFIFSNNDGVTVATMNLVTPKKVDIFELGDDLGINVNTQVTVDTID